ncbi:MAG: hypothetical protein ACFFA4_09835 [Promethearchaeota archaeon]
MKDKIIIIMGYPAFGKTLIAKDYETLRCHRLNRVEITFQKTHYLYLNQMAYC